MSLSDLTVGDLWQRLVSAAPLLSVIIALLALLRPEITSFFSKQKATLEFHLKEKIQLWMTADGIRLSIEGTLESLHSSHFIENIIIVLSRSDKAQKKLTWEFFESPIIGRQEATPSYPYNLPSNATTSGMFTFGEMASLPEKWVKLFSDFKKKFSDHFRMKNTEERDLRSLFNNFITSDGKSASHELFDYLSEQFYWFEGNYELLMTVKTKRPQKEYTFYHSFSINAEESKRLKNNIIRTQFDSCWVPDTIFEKIWTKLN